MSGLWSFRRKNTEQVVDSVLSALPTASVQVVAGASTLALDRDVSPQSFNMMMSTTKTTTASAAATTTASNNILANAVEESNDGIDPEWAALRSKWMERDLLHDDGDENDDSQDQDNEAAILEEAESARKWLYAASPPSKSPSPSKVREDEGPNVQRSLSRGLDDEAQQHHHQRQFSPDIVDYRALLARIDAETDAAKPQLQGTTTSAARAAPEPFIMRHAHPTTSSFITVDPVSRILSQNPQQSQQRQQQQLQQPPSSSAVASSPPTSSSRRRFPNSGLSPEMASSFARIDANLAEMSAKKQQQQARLLEQPSFLLEQQQQQQQKNSARLRDDLAVRSVVSTRLTFPTTAAAPTTAVKERQPLQMKRSVPAKAEEAQPPAHVTEMLRRGQQARSSAASTLKTAVQQQKPSARAQFRDSVASKFADPHSAEFKQQLDLDLKRMEQEIEQQQMKRAQQQQHKSVTAASIVTISSRASSSAASSTTAATTVSSPPPSSSAAVASRKLPPPPSSKNNTQQQQPHQSQQQQPAFVDRMMQRTREREEARKQLLQKYEQEKHAKIQREIQEAEEDAQRTLAERSRAAKLREKMQSKMRNEEERKIKEQQLAVAQEQLGEVMWWRHFIFHVGWAPWRRMMQRKEEMAQQSFNKMVLRRAFNGLKRNVAFNTKVVRAVQVTRIVGLTRLLRRWTMRLVMLQLRRNVLASRRDRRDAVNHRLRVLLRRWHRKTGRHHVKEEASKSEWAEAQCVETAHFRSRQQLRFAFRRWSEKGQKRQEKREREAIRQRMWSVAMAALQ